MTCDHCHRAHESAAWSAELEVVICDPCYRRALPARECASWAQAQAHYGRVMDAIRAFNRNQE